MIYKRGNNWYIGYSVNGIWKRETAGKSKRFAEIALGKRKADVKEGRFLDIRKAEKINFEEFAETFLSLHSRVNKKPKVVKRDKVILRNLCTHFGDKWLHEITPMKIEEYKKERAKDKIGAKNIANATINRELACLKCMFNKAIEWGKIDSNPMKKVKLLNENNTRVRYLEKGELQKLIEACPPQLREIVIVAAYTGMRKSEILDLKWQDISFEQGLIYIAQPKSGEREQVMMNETVRRALGAVKKNPQSNYVFHKSDGACLKDVRKKFETALKTCGIIDFRFHDLRHTFASQLVMNAVDIATVQKLMRHRSINVTMRYAHLSEAHKRNAIEVLDRELAINDTEVSTKIAQAPKIEEVNKIDSFRNSLKYNDLAFCGEVA